MKKILPIFVFVVCLSQLAQAKIWRVNNVPGIQADFTSAQAAHDGASANDTIYLESSPTSYGDIVATKKLTWIGLGNFLINNTGLQFHNNVGSIDYLTVNAGADGSVFQITQPRGSTTTINSCNNLTFLRCYLSSYMTVNGTTHNLTITQCFLNYGQGFMNIWPSSPQPGFTINNNIIVVNQIWLNGNCYQVTFNNNTLISNGIGNSILIDNGSIANNILYNFSSTGITMFEPAYPSNVTNNLWVGYSNTNFVGSNGNIYNAGYASVFVGGSSPDAQYKLVSGSPAIGAGAGGVDIGTYGGANPYVVSLIPAIPTIYQLSVPANATGNTLPCTVSTRANN